MAPPTDTERTHMRTDEQTALISQISFFHSGEALYQSQSAFQMVLANTLICNLKAGFDVSFLRVRKNSR